MSKIGASSSTTPEESAIGASANNETAEQPAAYYPDGVEPFDDLEVKIDTIIELVAAKDEDEILESWYVSFAIVCGLAISYRQGLVKEMFPKGVEAINTVVEMARIMKGYATLEDLYLDTVQPGLAQDQAGVGAAKLKNLGDWEYDWPEMSSDTRRAALLRESGLEPSWREYFESWSTIETFSPHGPFEPLELAAGLDISGATELLERVGEFEVSDRVEETRASFASELDKFASWANTYVPYIPEGLSGHLFSIDSGEENLARLRGMDAQHIWSVHDGNVPSLWEGFADGARWYYVTEQAHLSEGSYVCDLGIWVTCLLCDGDGYSEQDNECPACEASEKIMVDVSYSLFTRGLDFA
jgi:hypothetical protein